MNAMMKRASIDAGDDFGDNRVPGDGRWPGRVDTTTGIRQPTCINNHPFDGVDRRAG